MKFPPAMERPSSNSCYFPPTRLTAYSRPIAISFNRLPSEPAHQLIEAIRNPRPKAAFTPRFDWTEYERLLIAKNAVRGQQVYNLAIAIDPACPMRAAAVQLVRNVLQEVGTILVMRPDENATEIPEVIEVALASHHALDWVERKSKIPTVVSKVHLELAPIPAPVEIVSPAVPAGSNLCRSHWRWKRMSRSRQVRRPSLRLRPTSRNGRRTGLAPRKPCVAPKSIPARARSDCPRPPRMSFAWKPNASTWSWTWWAS